MLPFKFCKQCGVLFHKTPAISNGAWATRLFCSRTCSAQSTKKTMPQRFWEKVQKSDGNLCWGWNGAVNEKGYGFVSVHIGKTKIFKAHRVSWELHFGKIPDGLCVLHACDNPLCVNPDHLMLGTQKANLIDMVMKGRQQRVSRYGEKNNKAKLTNKQATEIREIYSTGKITQAQLGDEYGVSRFTIMNVVKNTTYTNKDYVYKTPQIKTM